MKSPQSVAGAFVALCVLVVATITAWPRKTPPAHNHADHADHADHTLMPSSEAPVAQTAGSDTGVSQASGPVAQESQESCDPAATGSEQPDALATAPIPGEKVGSPHCPVMHMTVTSLKYMSEYKGKAYYFCCPSCKPKFDQAPAQYAM